MNEEEAERVKSWRRAVVRSRRAQTFLSTDLWVELQDMLAERQQKLMAENLWDPIGKKSCEEIALRNSFNSGRSAEIEELLKVFHRWHSEGQEAAEKLKEMGVEI